MNVLQDKIAVVTGSAQGLGATIALAYAQAGAHVVLADRTPDTLGEVQEKIERLGRKALAVTVDIANLESVEACARKAQEHFGRVDILVNNAAIGGPAWSTTPPLAVPLVRSGRLIQPHGGIPSTSTPPAYFIAVARFYRTWLPESLATLSLSVQ